MSYRDAWIQFYCAGIAPYGAIHSAEYADYALDLLKERESKKAFDKPDTSYRGAPFFDDD
jgi:hypothetical protein